MIPPNLRYAWIPKILVTIGKESYHDILDLGSSSCILSKELYDLLGIHKKMKKSVILISYMLMILPSMF
jgi:hypothetical protein